jgi:hypothetical protein
MVITGSHALKDHEGCQNNEFGTLRQNRPPRASKPCVFLVKNAKEAKNAEECQVAKDAKGFGNLRRAELVRGIPTDDPDRPDP